MKIRISSNWVLRVSQVPNVEGRVLVIIIGNQELSWDLRVPNYVGLSESRLRFWHTFRPFVVSEVVILVILLELILSWLSEGEDRLTNLQVPHNDLTILTGTCQNVRDYPVPTYRGNPRALMEIWHTWFVHNGSFHV